MSIIYGVYALYHGVGIGREKYGRNYDMLADLLPKELEGLAPLLIGIFIMIGTIIYIKKILRKDEVNK